MNGDKIPERVLSGAFWYLNVRDLKSCREVSKYWRRISGLALKKKTVLVYNAQRKPSFFSKTGNGCADLLTYLTKSESKCSLWDCLQIREMTREQVKNLLHNTTLEISQTKIKLNDFFITITKLELVRCRIECLVFLEFLKLFNNLEMFVEVFSTFYSPSILDGLCCRIEKLEATVAEQIKSSKCHPFNSIAISQLEFDPNLRILLKVIDITATDLEEFSIILDTDEELHQGFKPKPTAGAKRLQMCGVLGLFLRKHSSTLRKLIISCNDVSHFADFMKVLKIFTNNFQDNDILEELTLNFPLIRTKNPEIENFLIPCLTKLKNLKRFRIESILCDGWDTLKKIRILKSTGDFEMQFGWISNDKYIQDSPTLEEYFTILQSELFAGLYSLFFTVHTFTPVLNSILPLYPDVKFENMLKLWIIVQNENVEPIFCEYNMDLLVQTFPYLTEFYIVDGLWFAYVDVLAEHQYDTMSSAIIGDDDIQAIFLELTCLKKLYLRARLTDVSDRGMTGISEDAYRRMINQRNFKITDPSTDFSGVRLSNLTCLVDFSLEGLMNITDITACLAFNGCENLKVLSLYGKLDLITRAGYDYLTQLERNNGIEMKTNL